MSKYNILIRKTNNSYEVVYNNDYDKKDCCIINIGNDKLNNIITGKEFTVSIEESKLKDFIVLEVDDKLINVLVDKLKERYPTFEKEMLMTLAEQNISNNLKKIFIVSINNENGIVDIAVMFKKNEMTINGNRNDSTVVNTNIITEIDMTKFEPNEVVSKIKEKVIGQDYAVETILYNIYHNQKLLESGDKDLQSSKVNILIDGPTGTGKTFILKEVASNLSIPMTIEPADSFSAPGYQGAKLEDVLSRLLDKTGGNIALAERGIVVFDEFDKLCVKEKSALEMHKAVQQNLLTYIGGTKISFEYKGQRVNFDTSKLTFICIGAFTDLRERKIKEELDENGNYTILPEDYIKEGMIRELVGRFSLHSSTRALGKEDYIKILMESKTSPLLNLTKAVKIYDKELIFDEELINKIADEAVKMNTGARALETIVQGIKNQILKTVVESTNEKEIHITLDYLDKYKEGFVRGVV